jgi:hypothetical protein
MFIHGVVTAGPAPAPVCEPAGGGALVRVLGAGRT